jgi:hypothetical protein
VKQNSWGGGRSLASDRGDLERYGDWFLVGSGFGRKKQLMMSGLMSGMNEAQSFRKRGHIYSFLVSIRSAIEPADFFMDYHHVQTDR